MRGLLDNHLNRLRVHLKTVSFLFLLIVGLVVFGGGSTLANVVNPGGGTATAVLTQTTLPASQTGSFSVAEVAEKANKAVVTITNLQTANNPYSGANSETGQLQPAAMGSGYIIDEAGHVVTNNHVIAGGSAFQVEFYDGTMVDATLVGADPFQDVAVLKLDLTDGQEVPGKLSFADSSTVRQGDQVVAMGTPFGEYNNTVTEGIVGALDRSLDTGQGYALPNLIQHSAPIYEGDSGGPLLNMQGEIIGMDVAKAMPQMMGSSTDTNIGFAIESNAVQPLVNEIIETGTVSRAYLGVRGQDSQAGQLVVSVETNGPAEQAGVQAGDVITAVNGQQITARQPLANTLLFNYKPGDTVKLTIDRDGSSLEISVTLGTRPAELS